MPTHHESFGYLFIKQGHVNKCRTKTCFHLISSKRFFKSQVLFMRNPIRELKIPQSIADATVFIEKGRKTILHKDHERMTTIQCNFEYFHIKEMWFTQFLNENNILIEETLEFIWKQRGRVLILCPGFVNHWWHWIRKALVSVFSSLFWVFPKMSNKWTKPLLFPTVAYFLN